METTDFIQARYFLYGLFARVFAREIDSSFLDLLREENFAEQLETFEIDLGENFLKQEANKLIEEHAVEYAALFLGPGPHISPLESVHHKRSDGDWGNLWGAATVEMNQFIEATGLHLQNSSEFPDHISIELELMQKLIHQELQDFQNENHSLVEENREIQMKFLENHLLCWSSDFFDLVLEKSELPFYSEFAKISKEFLLDDQQYLLSEVAITTS